VEAVADTEELKKYRSICLYLIFGHIAVSVYSFFLVGSNITAIGQAIYVLILFSMYKTLSSLLKYVYMALLTLNILNGIFSLITFESNLWYIGVVVFYVIALKTIYSTSFFATFSLGGGDQNQQQPAQNNLLNIANLG
jgi:hypothetical protein